MNVSECHVGLIVAGMEWDAVLMLRLCLPASWQVSSASLSSCDIRNRCATVDKYYLIDNDDI